MTEETLIIIPARGGSKGIPNKNIKPLAGKPLIAYTIQLAKETLPKAEICISTDSNTIKSVVEEYGLKVPFLRPQHLALDTSGTHEVLLHALDYYERKGKLYDKILLLQPTSPFRTKKQIKESIQYYSNELDMVVSVKQSKANPYYNLFEEKEGLLVKSKKGNFSRRQDIPKVYEYNGAIYVINTKSLKEKKMSNFNMIKKYEMDDISSLDIDSPLDWKVCELMLNEEMVKI